MNMNPSILFDMVKTSLPEELHRNVLIVGSLAAAYYHRDRLTGQVVATKDADVVIHPAGAVRECVDIAGCDLFRRWQEWCAGGVPEVRNGPVAKDASRRVGPTSKESSGPPARRCR